MVAGHSWVRQVTDTSTCAVVPSETANATGLCGRAVQFSGTPLMFRLCAPALNPEIVTACSYPGNTAGMNVGAAASTPKRKPFGSKSTFETTRTTRVPVATAVMSVTPVLGSLGSAQAAAPATSSRHDQERITTALGWSTIVASLVLLQRHEHLDNAGALSERFERLTYHCTEHPRTISALHRTSERGRSHQQIANRDRPILRCDLARNDAHYRQRDLIAQGWIIHPMLACDDARPG